MLKYLLVVAAPATAAIFWNVFAVQDDPSRSGKTPVPTPGTLCLLLELAIFAFASWCLYDSGLPALSYILGVLVAVH
jgi:hypothetical protein